MLPSFRVKRHLLSPFFCSFGCRKVFLENWGSKLNPFFFFLALLVVLLVLVLGQEWGFVFLTSGLHIHFSQCRVLGWWAKIIFFTCSHFVLEILSHPQPHSFVSRTLNPKFGPTDIAGSLRHLLNLSLTAFKLLLLHSSSAFPSPLCLTPKLMALQPGWLWHTVFLLKFIKAAKLLGFEATANA